MISFWFRFGFGFFVYKFACSCVKQKKGFVLFTGEGNLHIAPSLYSLPSTSSVFLFSALNNKQ